MQLMSTELAATTDDFLLTALKAAQDASQYPKAHCHKSPKRWMLIARHVVEDGMDVSAFLKTSGVTRNNYYDIKRSVETNDDYENIRAKAALDAATDYDIGVDLERAYTEKMIVELEKDNCGLEIDAKGYAQIQRGQSMKADRLNKFSGTVTQTIVVEHKSTPAEINDMIANLPEADVTDI
jgi:hypothetical protein